MATRPVRFEFQCEKAPEKLTYTHQIPATLINSSPLANQNNPDHINLFVSTLRPIVQQHEKECQSKASSTCENCGRPTVKVLQTPMSWLHIVDDPFVNIWVNAVCEQGECEITMRQEIQKAMMQLSSEADSMGRPGRDLGPQTKELLPCNVCGDTTATKRCSRCRVVAYCGREHQKQDWKTHKKVCATMK